MPTALVAPASRQTSGLRFLPLIKKQVLIVFSGQPSMAVWQQQGRLKTTMPCSDSTSKQTLMRRRRGLPGRPLLLLLLAILTLINRSGLAAFSDKALLSEALQFSIGPCVRSQDSVHLIGSIAKNRTGRDISWQFFKDNFQLLKGR